MALTDREKHKAVFYLGWSGQTLVVGSTHYNTVVNNRLDVTNIEICRIAKALLDKLAACDEQLEDAKCRLSASSVDNIKLNPEEINQIRKERLKCIRELSDHLDIPIVRSGGVNKSVVC